MTSNMQFDLIEAALHRPGMYTIKGSLVEVVCFYQGYCSALARSKSPSTEAYSWGMFQYWVVDKMREGLIPKCSSVGFNAYIVFLNEQADGCTTLLKMIEEYKRIRL